MATPSVSAALEAVIAQVLAITPTIGPEQRFRRYSESAPTTTQTRRQVDVEFGGHIRDLSNDGAGTTSQGRDDRVARLRLLIDYSKGRDEKALELLLAVDSELLLRALGRAAVWAGTPVQRCASMTTSVDRTNQYRPSEEGGGMLQLILSIDVQYRDLL